MEFKDYYKVMDVDREATQEQIKRSYRKLARKFHPDVSKEVDAEVRFKEVGEAYEVLKDPEKRAAYDQLGSNWKEGQDFKPPPNWDTGFEHSGTGFTGGDDATTSAFFEALFGRDFRSTSGASGQSSGFNVRGEDHHAKVLIDLEDSFHGGKQSITLRAPEIDVEGRVHLKERNLNVTIPKGVKPGQHIRLAGQGTSGMGQAPAGDLYLEVEFKPHDIYKIVSNDLTIEIPITPWEAALGTKIKVPTPTGDVDLTIPPGSSSGQKLRLKEQGFPAKKPSNLIVILQLVLPPADSDEAKALYQEMEQKLKFNPRMKLGV